MTEVYECKVCGVVSNESDSLCHPTQQEDPHDYCGTTRAQASMCSEVKESLSIVCGSCGRPAKQADLVCKPLVLG